MQESTSREHKSEKGEGAESEATSKELLSDVEETEMDTGQDAEPGPGPSPDGALDESGERKDAGPI